MLRTLGGAAIDFETLDVPAGGATLDPPRRAPAAARSAPSTAARCGCGSTAATPPRRRGTSSTPAIPC